MRNYYTIILYLIIVLPSCRDDDHLYLDYLTRYKETIDVIDQQNNLTLSEFKDLLVDHSEKSGFYYELMSMPKQKKIRLFHLFDSIIENKTNIPFKKITEAISNQNIPSLQVRFEKSDLDLMKFEIDNYKSSILSTIHDSRKYPALIERLSKTLSTENLTSILSPEQKRISLTELLAYVYKIKAEITIAEAEIISFLNSQVDVESWKFNKMEIFVVPNSQVIPTGSPYQATIFPAAYDTTFVPIFEIEGKKFEAVSCKLVYRHKVLEKSGEHSILGNCMTKSPYNGKTKILTFKIEYEVLPK
jgi:hypothetical protein